MGGNLGEFRQNSGKIRVKWEEVWAILSTYRTIGGLQLAAMLVDIAKHVHNTAQEFDTDSFYKYR